MGIRTLIVVLVLGAIAPAQQNPSTARELIRQRRYGEAISKLEELFESSPGNAEGLSLMGAVHLYSRRDYLKAKSLFEESFAKGGGAIFWVHHSHEKLGEEFFADYCRGWLTFDKTGITLAADFEGDSFTLPYSAVKELKKNRLGRALFHIKDGARTFNFRPRTSTEDEVLLIIAIYKKFSDSKASNRLRDLSQL